MSLPFDKTATTELTDTGSPGEENIPLSFSQQRLWFLDQLHPRSPLYNVPSAVRLKGPLDPTALRKALETIIDRHEVLRTVYELIGDSPTQRILDTFNLEFSQTDLSCLTATSRETELSRRLHAESRRAFNLSNELLIRAALYRLNIEEHVLFLNIHHIACDEWSLGILYRELATIYSSLTQREQSELRELPIQYADFAFWQHDSMQGGVLEKQLGYWEKRFTGELPVLELPIDRPRPTQPSGNGGTVRRTFSRDLSASLKTLCNQEGVTLYMLLLASFKTLLHRYSGHEDIVVGTPISGRNRVETEDLIGFFVNTLAIRTTIDGALPFRDLLSRVRDEVLQAFSYQDVPFEKIVEHVQPDRTSAQNPIFNVMFSLQNHPDEIRIPGLTVTPVEIESSVAKFDLTLVAQDTLDGLTAVAEFNKDIFELSTIERLLGHLETLLEGIVSAPEKTIGTLPLLTTRERQTLLMDWNATETDFPKNTPIHQIFETQVARTPHAIAAVYGHEVITYRQLDERSSQLANYLQRFPVANDVLVGVCLERSIEMIISWLAVLKAGAAYVPLDPGYPSERIGFMLEDTRMPVVITQKKLAGKLPNETHKICIDSDWKNISRESTNAPARDVSSENLAYVIYTSGSTGKPKGVPVPHRAIARLVFNTNYIHLDKTEVVAQASNSSFDAATFEVWGALLHGGKLVGIKQDVLLSPRDFANELGNGQVTTLFVTTALFNQIAADVPDAFCRLKNVLFGGEACDPKAVKEILTHGPPQRLLHVYGPTETTTFASWFEVKSVPTGAKTLPIGKPISNTTFYVLDKNMQPVPVGVPGELHVGGVGLARGYWNRPELTATKFVPCPFDPQASARLYKTGDVVRYLPNGNIEFLGRIDNQVKIRGFRIELEEIETVLKLNASIRDAIVLARDENGGKRLAAYVIPKSQPAPSSDELRNYMKGKLPDFMVPSAFVFLENFPLTPNGKIDRRALPAPQVQLSTDKSYLLPRNNLENQLRKIFESVLGTSAIGIRDNFFELGGHSLLAIRLFTQIEKKLGLKLPLSTLFQAPTIEQLAQIIGKKAWSAPGASLVEIQPKGTLPPIFWLHTLGGGGGGGLFTYRKLAEYLGPDQPSYGLVTPPEPFTELEQMAAHYINEMRTIQPTGPYHLAGYCFGGVIAFEMARQLRSKGMKVGLLALIESTPPNLPEKNSFSPELALHFCKSLPGWLKYNFDQNPFAILSKVANKGRNLTKKLSRRVNVSPPANESARIQERIGEIIDFSAYPADFKHFAEIHWRALDKYSPGAFDGRITLFRSQRPRLLELDPEVAWRKLAHGGVDVRIVPGTHETVLDEPYVKHLARELALVLHKDKVEILQAQAA